MNKTIAVFLLIALLISLISLTACRQDEQDRPDPPSETSATDEPEQIAPDFSFSLDLSLGAGTETFYYADGWFTRPAEKYSPSLATLSFGLAAAAFGDTVGGDRKTSDYRLARFFSETGFEGYAPSREFHSEPEEYGIAFGMAHKKIGDATLIALAFRGENYGKEWVSNFHIGTEGDHYGFSLAADQAEEEIAQYLEREGVTGKLSFWVTGYSRAAAVANLTAARLIDSAYAPKGVYAYCFEPPAATVDPNCGAERYASIFSLLDPNDLVTRVPPSTFGFSLYGTRLYYPSAMVDPDCAPEAVTVEKLNLAAASVTPTSSYRNYNSEVLLDDGMLFLSQVCFGDRAGYEEFALPLRTLIGLFVDGEISERLIFDLADALMHSEQIAAIDGGVPASLDDEGRIRFFLPAYRGDLRLDFSPSARDAYYTVYLRDGAGDERVFLPETTVPASGGETVRVPLDLPCGR